MCSRKQQAILTAIAVAFLTICFSSCVKTSGECRFTTWRWHDKEGGVARLPKSFADSVMTIADINDRYYDFVQGDTVNIQAYLCTDTVNRCLFLSDTKAGRLRYDVPGGFSVHQHLPLRLLHSSDSDSWTSSLMEGSLSDTVIALADSIKCNATGTLMFVDMGGCKEKMSLVTVVNNITIEP